MAIEQHNLRSTRQRAFVSPVFFALARSVGIGCSDDGGRDEISVPRVLFVTTDLAIGGAEIMLWKLLSRQHGRGIDAAVVSLLGPGLVSGHVESLGVPVWHLGLEQPWRLLVAVWQLARIVQRFRPEAIQGWMYHGNLTALAARSLAPGRPRLFWSIRQTLSDMAREKPATRVVIRLGAWWSRRVDGILYNSELSRRQHEALGYEGRRAQVIDNGFDTDRYYPETVARSEVRQALGLDASAVLLGLIARYHPMKGHEVFLQAAGRLAARVPDVHFLLVGRGADSSNPVLTRLVDTLGLSGCVHLLGERSDIPRLTAALNIATSSSSWGEAFPNALGEAMACEVPCVATDVGDVRRILGGTGEVVPVGDSDALAAAWERWLSMSEAARRQRGEAARRRVVEHFSLDHVAKRYIEFVSDRAKRRSATGI